MAYGTAAPQQFTKRVLSAPFLALLLCLHPHGSIADSLPQTSSDIRSVTSATRLQRAIVDGVRHIVVSKHISVADLQADPEGLSASVDNAIGDLTPSTRSIVVRMLPISDNGTYLKRAQARGQCGYNSRTRHDTFELRLSCVIVADSGRIDLLLSL
jgi:hypothetical protein